MLFQINKCWTLTVLHNDMASCRSGQTVADGKLWPAQTEPRQRSGLPTGQGSHLTEGQHTTRLGHSGGLLRGPWRDWPLTSPQWEQSKTSLAASQWRVLWLESQAEPDVLRAVWIVTCSRRHDGPLISSLDSKMTSFTKEQWLTIITFVVVNFCNAMCASMQVNIHPGTKVYR